MVQSLEATFLQALESYALLQQPDLASFSGQVSDSGEGRSMMIAAIDEGISTSILNAALGQRLALRGEDSGSKLLTAMRLQFGRHEKQHSEIKS